MSGRPEGSTHLKESLQIFVALIVFAFPSILNASQAQDATLTFDGQTAGPTPFIANVKLIVTPASTLKSVGFAIAPRPGSVTRPLSATYSRNYLQSHGKFDPQTGIISLTVFGLYSNYNNTVTVTGSFMDGSTTQRTTRITTAVYNDPCALNTPTVRQARTGSTELSYDFVLVAGFCGKGSPVIIDTDGAVRWVGTTGMSNPVATFYDNAVYFGDGPRLFRIELDGTVTIVRDYSDIGVLLFSHNLDRGKHGLIADVHTTGYVGTENIEVDAAGNVLRRWNPAKIISAAMIAGGDNPTEFVKKSEGVYGFGSPEDWWHNNSVAYRVSDDSLLISSRENFVICIDYETNAIKWIFGDITKQWYQFPSLRKYALAAGPDTLPPDGQHSVSITHDNNLLLLDNGRQSQHHVPRGPSRSSASRKYDLDLEAKTATEVWTYPEVSNFQTPFCSSVYEDAPSNYLIDYAQVNSPQGRYAEILGLTAAGEKVFDYTYPTNRCDFVAYRSLPVHWENLVFDTPADAQLANISSRALIGTGDKAAIAGFIISGGAKSVIVRGIGPSLQVEGQPLPGRLLDPILDLYDSGGSVLRHNDNYKGTTDASAIAAAKLSPTDAREAAIIGTLQPGAYTAVLRGASGGSGIGLVEVYDGDGSTVSKLSNLSTRAFVAGGDNVLIGGLIVGGTNPQRVLFRAIGPELQANGITDALQDTTIRLINADGTQLETNDDWRQAADAAEIAATGVPPQDDRESAILMSLTAGTYTVIVQGKENATGTALVEAYQLH